MAEYIDRKQLLELINEDCEYKKPTNEYTRGCNDVCEWAIKTIENMPTADVVPKSEVERLKRAYEGSQKTIKGLTEMIREKNKELAKLETHLELHYGEKSLNNLIAEERADVAREIFEEIEKCLCQRFSDEVEGEYRITEEDFAGLKKKYTESSNGEL